MKRAPLGNAAATAPVPASRVHAVVDRPERARGSYVLYWMTAARRTRSSFALQHAVHVAERRRVPLVVLEALRAGHRWASARHHAFVLQGMASNATAFAGARALYFPYVEPEPGAGRGLVAALAARATCVVTDDWPCYFLPRMLAAARRELDPLGVRLEAVDGVGLVPFRAPAAVFPTAYAFRRWLQRHLPLHLAEPPLVDPLDDRNGSARLVEPDALDAAIERRWPRASARLLALDGAAIAQLPIDRAVGVVASRAGGECAARRSLAEFVRMRLPRYAEERSEPASDASSGLSPWLHYGHLSAHEAFAAVAERERWSLDRLSSSTAGKRSGWWGLGASAEAFLDELVTWRELGLNFCGQRDDYDRYASLPEWARNTLAKHARDPRPHLYEIDELEAARTHDPLWNAAQRQLLREGVVHNYLRMLWGKKILEWSPTPEVALERMIELNNRWALDGRDPNSYSGIFWVLGRYDRAWGPERPIYGTVRYLSSENTARKLDVEPYLARYGPTRSVAEHSSTAERRR